MSLHQLLLLASIFGGFASADLHERAPCVVPANGFEAVDDSPAINAALQECGDGGTILLPEDQFYSIRSVIDFTPCHNCDFQIEGTLVVGSGQWAYWENVPSVFSLLGVTGAHIHSLTGKGSIDGNAIPWYINRWDSGFLTTRTFIDITNSTAITISNLSIKNVMQRFIRIHRHTTHVSLSQLFLTATEQWGVYPRNEVDVGGIEIGESSNISITHTSMAFSTRPSHPGPVGVCIPIDIDTHTVAVQNLTCTGAWGGVLVALNTIGTIRPTPAQLADTISDIRVTDLVFDSEGGTATGFASFGHDATIRDVVFERVMVLAGSPAGANLCFLKLHSSTPYVPTCWRTLRAVVTEVWFRGFRGRLPTMPGEGWGWENYEVARPEYRFEDWRNGTGTEV